jgi:protein tyrosine kinase modulator
MREAAEQVYEQLWIALHHRRIALLCAVFICVIGWTVVEKLPNKFQAQTKVYLDTQTVLKSLLSGLAVDNKIREQSAQIMQRTLVTRLNLKKVIDETDLNLNIKNPLGYEKLIKNLGSSIQISSVSLLARQNPQSSNLYRISYTNTDPVLAKNVVDVLLNIFVESVLGASRKDTYEAQAFLDEQIEEYEIKQHKAEEKLKHFKLKNSGLMPEEGSSYYSKINSLETKLNETKLSLREAENRSIEIKSQIDRLVVSASASEKNNLELIKDPLDIRIENLEAKLDEFLLQYTENHPDVISTRRALLQLKKQKEIVSSKTSSENNISSSVMNSPLYQDLNVMLGKTKSEAAALRIRVQEYEKQKKVNEELIKTLPAVEAELANLNRDYQINKGLYEDLVKRRESSELSYQAEQTGDELQFKIIEPPIVPLIPVSPNRILFSTFVLIAAFAGGIGIALLYEQMNPTYYTRQQLIDNVSLPVLGSVSMYWSDVERSKRKMEILFFTLIVLLLLAAYTGLLIHNGFGAGVKELLAKYF